MNRWDDEHAGQHVKQIDYDAPENREARLPAFKSLPDLRDVQAARHCPTCTCGRRK